MAKLFNRTKSRILAVEMLYAMQLREKFEMEIAYNALDIFSAKFSNQIEKFALELVQGVLDNQTIIDDFIKKNSINWSFERITTVDLQILRVAFFEILYAKSKVPKSVGIHEAIIVAKHLSSMDSIGFINAVLDKADVKVD